MEVIKRIMQKKIASEMSWDDIAHKAGIRISSWMTGLPVGKPTDEEIRKLAVVFGTTYEWLKEGKE